MDFKTIHECRLELVAQTTLASGSEYPEYFQAPANLLAVSAARASFGREDKTGENPAADLKLMKYLADHEHLTPFEYNHATFLVECPLFIRSQIHRHRTFSYNEISRRYTSEDIAFWIPDKWRKQSGSNKQASTGEEVQENHLRGLLTVTKEEQWHKMANVALGYYRELVEMGVCREQARAVLPQSLLTRFYMGGNLRNWAHFIRLRKAEGAQYEVRVVAERIEAKLRELWPEALDALIKEESSSEETASSSD